MYIYISSFLNLQKKKMSIKTQKMADSQHVGNIFETVVSLYEWIVNEKSGKRTSKLIFTTNFAKYIDCKSYNCIINYNCNKYHN